MIGLMLIAALAKPYPLNEAWQPPIKRWKTKGLAIHGRYSTIGHFFNDTDFDDTPRFYDPGGQTDAQVASYFRPGVTITPRDHSQIFYQAELGWDAWSAQDAGEEGLTIRHRQLWARWGMWEGLDLEVGFQRVRDPSGLFLNHDLAAVSVGGAEIRRKGGARIIAAMAPDDTEEGLDEDNLKHDTAILGLVMTLQPDEWLWDAAGYWLWDRHVVDRPLSLGVGVLGVRDPRGAFWAHAMLQAGAWEAAALGGEDQTILAWAAQAGGVWAWGEVSLILNALVASPDDAHHGNAHQGAPLLSGRNDSSTLMLTEDEYRDRHRNLDERLSARHSAFFQNRAGLGLADATLGYAVERDYVMSLILGGAVVLEPDNALGERFMGAEVDWVHEIYFPDGDSGLYLSAQLLLPGGAAAAYVNDVDRTKTEPIYGGQLGFVGYF